MTSAKSHRGKLAGGGSVAERSPGFGFARRGLWEAVLILAFLLVCGFDILHHAMWRDEMLPWLFARDSATIPDLFKNMRYETHPRLWYLILFGITRITSNPAAMQAANFLIIGLAIALFVRFCPLPFYLKALTVFGYFFVYEWGTLSRNYALGVLLCFAFCTLFPKRGKGYLGLAAILFLATQANHYAALQVAALGGLLIFEAWTKPELRSRIRTHRWDAALSVFLVFGGVLLAFWIGIPQPDAGIHIFDLGLGLGVKITHSFIAFWAGFVPLSEPSLLNSWVMGMLGHTLLGAAELRVILGMILFPLTVVFFWRSHPIMWTYLGGASLLLLLASVKFNNYARHTGHFFLWFLICLWLAHYFPESSGSPKTRPFKLSLSQKLFLCPLLLIHIFDSVFLSIAGYYYPFSCSKAVALYLEQNHLKGLPIVGYPDYIAMPVAGYAGVRIYYPDTRRWGSFVIENDKRQTDWTEDEIMKSVSEFAAQGNHDFLLLLNGPLMIVRDNQLYEVRQLGDLHEEASFHPSMVGDEIYWLYRYKTPPTSSPEPSRAP